MNFVKWSRQGNFVLFYEFYYNSIYHYIYIDFSGNAIYRINMQKFNDNDLVFLDNLLNEEYDEIEILNEIKKLGIRAETSQKDQFEKRTFYDIIFGFNKWIN